MGIDVGDMSSEQWAWVDDTWKHGGTALDTMIEIYREHREGEDCAHPACSSEEFEHVIMNLSEVGAKIILHVAIHRLETLRLEKEAGL